MDFTNIPLLSMVKTKMAYLGERQTLLAQNVSNMDTPGYVPRDLKPLDFGHILANIQKRLTPATTSPLHIPGLGGPSPRFVAEAQDPTYETKPVKNSVVLEEQMFKIADNNNQYQVVTSVYRKMGDLFRSAIGNRT